MAWLGMVCKGGERQAKSYNKTTPVLAGVAYVLYFIFFQIGREFDPDGDLVDQ